MKGTKRDFCEQDVRHFGRHSSKQRSFEVWKPRVYLKLKTRGAESREEKEEVVRRRHRSGSMVEIYKVDARELVK